MFKHSKFQIRKTYQSVSNILTPLFLTAVGDWGKRKQEICLSCFIQQGRNQKWVPVNQMPQVSGVSSSTSLQHPESSVMAQIYTRKTSEKETEKYIYIQIYMYVNMN